MCAGAFGYDPKKRQWSSWDHGNGEQVCWWTWAMLALRRELGLAPLP